MEKQTSPDVAPAPGIDKSTSARVIGQASEKDGRATEAAISKGTMNLVRRHPTQSLVLAALARFFLARVLAPQR